MNVGGPAIQVTGLIKGLSSTEYEQLLVTGYCEEDEADYLLENNIELSEVRIDGLGRSIQPWSDLSSLWKIRQLMKSFRPDVVHTHTAKAGLLGRLASISLRQGHLRIHTYHGHLLHGYFGPWKTRLVIDIEKILASFTHSLVAVGQVVRDDLISKGIGKESQYSIIAPGFDMNSVKRNISRKDLQLSDETLVCLWVGRLVQIKRPERILEIARETNQMGLDISYIVAGGGTALDKLRKIANEERLPINFLGWRNDVETLVSISDLVLLTSDNEGTPISIIQAQRIGKPVIATDVGSVREVLLPGESGVIVDYSPKAFAEEIRKFSVNPSRYLNFSNSAKSFAAVRFSLERLVNDHESLYRRLVKNQSSS